MTLPPAERFLTWTHALRASDRAAFSALYDATFPPLYRYVWTITRDEEAAADVLQDVFVKLWLVRAGLDPARSLKALLFQMARNAALNHVRSRKLRAADPLDAEHEPPDPAGLEDALDADRLEDRIHGWIDALPPRRREAFRLSRFDGLSHDEIAVVMDLAPKTVNNHIVLALQTLRALLAEHDAPSDG